MCVVAWGVFEPASSAYDIYNAASTVADPCAKPGAKAAAVGGMLLGMVAPGGAYGTTGSAAAKGADEFVDLASAARRRHILDGEVRPNGSFGGGHRAGNGFPGKSEFPRGWSDGK